MTDEGYEAQRGYSGDSEGSILYSLGVARGQIIGINCENWISGRVSFCLRDTKTNPKLDLASETVHSAAAGSQRQRAATLRKRAARREPQQAAAAAALSTCTSCCNP